MPSTVEQMVARNDDAGMERIIAAVWAFAGGTAAGLLVLAIVLTGRVHPDAVLIITAGLAVIGSTLGSLHGAVLAIVGGAADHRPRTVGQAVVAVASIVVAFGLAFGMAMWLAMSAVVARSGSTAGWLAVMVGVAFAAVVMTWATLLGWRAFDRAYHRWPDHRLGTLLVAGAFTVLLALFLALRPAIPGTEIQLPVTLCILLAALATLWVATPAVVIGLRLLHRQQRTAPLTQRQPSAAARSRR